MWDRIENIGKRSRFVHGTMCAHYTPLSKTKQAAGFEKEIEKPQRSCLFVYKSFFSLLPKKVI